MLYILLISLLVICYTYVGYPLILFVLTRFKPYREVAPIKNAPSLAVLIAAYNEEDFIEDKLKNTIALQYPGKKRIVVVADGSNDKTVELVKGYEEVELLYEPERKGKIAAVNRAMHFIQEEITVHTDANTMLPKAALCELVKHFKDDKIGAVSGEKKIATGNLEDAATSGEGIYWKYESLLKKWDYQLNSIVGAAGELIAIRTNLHEDVPADTIIEDFYMTMKLCQKGYKVAYEPKAFALESGSASIKEEMKRKVRICAGGFQAIGRLGALLNPFKYGFLSFQYISHRVLRWTLAPLSLVLCLISNTLLAYGSTSYSILFLAQILFYGLALIGFYFQKRKIKLKALYVPYYFTMMNYTVFVGLLKYFMGQQGVVWEKSLRKLA